GLVVATHQNTFRLAYNRRLSGSPLAHLYSFHPYLHLSLSRPCHPRGRSSPTRPTHDPESRALNIRRPFPTLAEPAQVALSPPANPHGSVIPAATSMRCEDDGFPLSPRPEKCIIRPAWKREQTVTPKEQIVKILQLQIDGAVVVRRSRGGIAAVYAG